MAVSLSICSAEAEYQISLIFVFFFKVLCLQGLGVEGKLDFRE